MIPFPIKLRPGAPIYEQIVHAARLAVASGRLAPGDRFPSVREIGRELNVNPNTVQKAVAELTAQGVLEVHVGQGCFVARRSATGKAERAAAMRPLIERLLVEAAHLGLDETQLYELIRTERNKIQ